MHTKACAQFNIRNQLKHNGKQMKDFDSLSIFRYSPSLSLLNLIMCACFHSIDLEIVFLYCVLRMWIHLLPPQRLWQSDRPISDDSIFAVFCMPETQAHSLNTFLCCYLLRTTNVKSIIRLEFLILLYDFYLENSLFSCCFCYKSNRKSRISAGLLSGLWRRSIIIHLSLIIVIIISFWSQGGLWIEHQHVQYNDVMHPMLHKQMM